MEQNEKRVVLVTGSNKGIGLEVARQLGRVGITVLLAVRDERRGTTAVEPLRSEGLDAHRVRLDVTEEASVRDAAALIGAQFNSAPEAAATPVRLALLRHDRPTGRFLNTEGEVAW